MSKAQVTRSETVAVQPTDTEQSANRCPGLVWAFHFSADGTSQELSEFTLPPHVVDRRGDDGWLWVHVNLSDARAATYLRAHLDDLPKAAVNLLLSIGEHQQLHAEDACVYGVFADLVYLLEGLTDELGLLHFVATEKRLITGRLGRFEQNTWQTTGKAHDLKTSQVAQRLDWLDHEMVALRDRAHLLQEEVSLRMTDQTNRNLQLLTIVTTVFLPAGVISSIFGMNVGGLPLEHDRSGFIVTMLLLIGASGLVFLILKRLGMLRR